MLLLEHRRHYRYTNNCTMDPSLYKRKRRDKIYDKLHRSFVNTCIGVTAAASLFLGYKVYEYFRYVRPLQTAQSKLAQDELLIEGRHTDGSFEMESST